MNKKDENYSFPTWLKIILFIFGLVLLFSSIFIIFKYATSLIDGLIPDYPNRDDWGVFGDFFGGVLNPIFGFASFLALLATIFYQAKELNASTKELKNSATALAAQNKAIELQSFEQTFFSWLLSYQELLKSIESDNVTFENNPNGKNTIEKIIGTRVKNPKNGRSQLYYWMIGSLHEQSIWNYIKSNKDGVLPKSSIDKAMELKLTNREAKGYLLSIANLHPNIVVDHILGNWNELYLSQEFQLDSMFRTLYRLISWVDSQHESRLSVAQKWMYINIIRSQISWIEMFYLFFNGLTDRGNKFKFFSEKYALFDNLTVDSDATIEVIKTQYAQDKNYSDTAFNSELARQKLGLPKSSEKTLALATTRHFNTHNPLAAPSA